MAAAALTGVMVSSFPRTIHDDSGRYYSETTRVLTQSAANELEAEPVPIARSCEARRHTKAGQTR